MSNTLPPDSWIIKESMFEDECFVIDSSGRVVVAECSPAVAALLVCAREVEEAAREFMANRGHTGSCGDKYPQADCDCGYDRLRAALGGGG